jgi:hypothetical protein
MRYALDDRMSELNPAEENAWSALLSLAGEKTVPMTLSDTLLELFERLRELVYGFLLRLTNNPDEAEDLTQETFLRLFRHLRAGLSPRVTAAYPDLPAQPRNSGFPARPWNRRSGGGASTSTITGVRRPNSDSA